MQKEVDLLIQPAIERLKDKGRERDRATQEYLEAKERGDSFEDDVEEDEDEDEKESLIEY